MVAALPRVQSAPRVRKRPASHTPLLHRWRQFPAAIAAPHFELTADEFAAILSTYKLLRAEGEPFDPMLVALMTVLERQAAETVDGFEDETDGDDDASDGQEWGNR